MSLLWPLVASRVLALAGAFGLLLCDGSAFDSPSEYQDCLDFCPDRASDRQDIGRRRAPA